MARAVKVEKMSKHGMSKFRRTARRMDSKNITTTNTRGGIRM